MRIGIFGGSFNPIHVGHVSLARQLLRLAALDEVWLMVSPQNPLKLQSGLLDDEKRLQMARMALEGEEHLVACDYEFRLARPSYTWNTLQHLRQDYPEHQFVLIIGGDNWQIFHHWYRAEDILKNFRIVVYPRRGSSIDRERLPESVSVADTELLDISSTQVRQRAARGESVAGMVPDSIVGLVQQYYFSPHI